LIAGYSLPLDKCGSHKSDGLFDSRSQFVKPKFNKYDIHRSVIEKLGATKCDKIKQNVHHAIVS
jgi:hypothetical protein